MLNADLLAADATLNHFEVLDAITFIPGEDLRIVIRLKSLTPIIRYVPDAGVTLNIDLRQKDGTTLTIAGTILDADDRSIWFIDLDEAQTLTTIATNIDITLLEGATTTKAQIRNGLTINGDC